MPDTPIEPGGPRAYPSDLEARVAVLEHLSRTTAAAIERIDRRLDTLDSAQRADFRWLMGTLLGLLGVMVAGWASLLGVMAHGFHWL